MHKIGPTRFKSMEWPRLYLNSLLNGINNTNFVNYICFKMSSKVYRGHCLSICSQIKNQCKRVFTCRILVRTSLTSTRTLLALPRISKRLHEPGELSISSASMNSRLQIRIIKSHNIEIYSFVQNSLWTCAIC